MRRLLINIYITNTYLRFKEYIANTHINEYSNVKYLHFYQSHLMHSTKATNTEVLAVCVRIRKGNIYNERVKERVIRKKIAIDIRLIFLQFKFVWKAQYRKGDIELSLVVCFNSKD